MSKDRLILLPGMGADARLFALQRKAFPHLETPDWIAPESQETLSAYARRWAKTITPDPPLVLGGVSFGGMVACEAARIVKPRAVILIASCRSRRSIPGTFKIAERLSRVFPDVFFERLRDRFVRLFARLERLSPEQSASLGEQAADAKVSFLRWAARAITTWEACEGQADLSARVYQIHGLRDRLISIRGSNADCLIIDGGHLINVTHAAEVNAFIQSVLSRGTQ